MPYARASALIKPSNEREFRMKNFWGGDFFRAMFVSTNQAFAGSVDNEICGLSKGRNSAPEASDENRGKRRGNSCPRRAGFSDKNRTDHGKIRHQNSK